LSRIITRLLPLLLLCLFHSGSVSAQQRDKLPSLNLGDAVVTGFSGTIAPDPNKQRPANKSAIDLTFINPDGPSARIVDVSKPGYVWDGRLFAAPKKFDVFAKDVGQVFGVALDDSAQPNIYVAATSVFGLNIVGRGRDGAPERRKKGGPGAGWMQGQFGLDLQGGPGGIYKIDGRTGVVTLFANVTLDGVPNPGTGLGNLAYDSAHKQLFVSDLYTGMIHRFDLDGKELGRYDHGVTGLGAAKLAAVPFNPRNRPNIASDRFDSEKPDSWGFTPAARRVWGLAVNEGRLYYSVMSGPQIWSVGITRDGDFADNPRWELDVPAQAGPLPISDIAFSQSGAMILAQRALIAASYDYSAFTQPGEPQVFRVWLKGPNDPPSPGRWKLTPEEYAVGFAGNNRNSNGGVALGYGYGADVTLGTTVCEASLWSTGQNLRNNPALRSQLEPGGPLVVHGLQGSPANMVRNANTPPTASYFIDYDDKFDDPSASGHIGSVRIYTTPCASTAFVRPVAASPAGGGGGGGSGGGGSACYSPGVPTSLLLPPQSLPPCTRPGQPVSLDLSTVLTSPGFDPNWAVTPYGLPYAHSTFYLPWITLFNHWIQPKPSATIQDHPVGTYVYTRKFNLACRPESYRSLKLTGQYGSDNSSVVTLNAPTSILATSAGSYNTPAVNLIPPPPSFFVPGLNVLTVTVKNNRPVGQGMNPTGMSMIATVEAICGPDCICGCPPGSVVNKDGVCLPVTPIDLKIDKENTPGGGGGTWFNVWVTNVGPPITFPAGGITIDEVIPSGMTVTSVTGTGWTCVPPTMAGPGTMHCTYNLAGSLATNASLSSTMIVNYTTTGPGPFINCAIVGVGSSVGTDTNPSNDKACAEVTGTPIDVGIAKTGGTTPVCNIGAYAWHLTVTNGANPWPGTGNIVVTDTVPANMTFSPIVAPGWSCIPPGGPAGTLITCTYTGTGPTANQVLPPINMSATATVGPPFPPYTNCAAVAIPSSSGYVDSNPANNNSCATVSKPSSCSCPPPQVMNIDGFCVCPPPMVIGPVPGTCVCPQGSVLVGGACVPISPPPPICQPPQIMIPGVGCRCPDDGVLVGKECVKKIVCDRPLVPNADGTKCVEVAKPKREDKCMRGYFWNGKTCVKRKTEPKKEEKSRELPDIRIPGGFPGLGGGGGGGGGRGGQSGGGASPGTGKR
jgi:hypothetical protein